jgi:hypothetical protein
MSSVVIAGDTSGSVTLQAPAVAGSTVLTLPAQTGTVMVNGPAFRANTVTAQTFTTSTFTKVAYNVEEFDTNSNYDPTTNYRFTPTVAGYYQINANVSMGGGSVGYVQCSIYKNGGAYAGGSGIPNNGNVGGMVSASTVIYCNGSTDYIEFYVWQNQGSSLNLQTSPGFNTFSGAMIRSA